MLRLFLYFKKEATPQSSPRCLLHASLPFLSLLVSPDRGDNGSPRLSLKALRLSPFKTLAWGQESEVIKQQPTSEVVVEPQDLWKVVQHKFSQEGPWCTKPDTDTYGVGVWRSLRKL